MIHHTKLIHIDVEVDTTTTDLYILELRQGLPIKCHHVPEVEVL
jgi:hypothetical protein